MNVGSDFKLIEELAIKDVNSLMEAQKSYGDSWRSRGGVGAFMMLARKWDRIENQTEKFKYDIFDTILNDHSVEGILDDVKDLRCYLLLVEAYVTSLLKEEYNENN